MPAYLPAQNQAMQMGDVVGCHSSDNTTFVRHVAIACESIAVQSFNSIVHVHHMAPPIEVNKPMSIDCWATAQLSGEEQILLNNWIDARFQEQQLWRLTQPQLDLDAYSIVPAIRYDATKLRTRYSCAGFVVAGFQVIGISLLPREDDLPSINQWEILIEGYPEQERLLQNERVRERFLGSRQGPWQIMLPGYLIHSLARPIQEIRQEPYVPEIEDRYYP